MKPPAWPPQDRRGITLDGHRAREATTRAERIDPAPVGTWLMGAMVVGRWVAQTNCHATGSTMMNIQQLIGRYLRLKQDLEIAYRTHPWQSAHINRLANDISRTEFELASREYVNRSAQ
jgi:hypothetical protein